MIYTCEPEESRAQRPACPGVYWECLSTPQPQTLHRFCPAWWKQTGHTSAKRPGTTPGCVPPGKTSRSGSLSGGSPASLPQAPCWALATAQFLTKLSPLAFPTASKWAARKNPPRCCSAAAKALGCLVYFGGRHLMLCLSPQDTAHSRRDENTPDAVGSRKWDSSLLANL